MEEILEYNYEDEMKNSFRDYAVSVIVGRALPDVRDGLKPVHRRILYAMRDLGILPTTPYKKSARIVGEIIGKYHPHGDSAVYDSMVKMSQNFRMNAPFVDGHGNFGSIDGDSPAAMRYTEARLSPYAMILLQDLEKNVVDFKENYDGSEREPVLIPSKFPQLLVNGYLGIAVGMKGSVPPHNLNEVIDAFLHYLKKPNCSIDELIEIMPAPDYPTGGILINKEEVKNLYRTGEAKAIIRSKIEIEPASYGKTNIVITEIPFTLTGNKTKLVNDIAQMIVDKKMNELMDIRDESSKDGIRIVLEVKKGVDIDKFLKKLYAKTKIQDSESYQFLALVDGKPTTLNLIDYFHHYLEFQKEIITRKNEYLYEKGLVKKEILDGLIEAIDLIDPIVEAIRGSKNLSQMKKCLMYGETKNIDFRLKKNEKIATSFSFTEKQAKAILEMKLQRLGALEVEELRKDHEKLLKELAAIRLILDDEKAKLKAIRSEHLAIKKEHGVARKTEITEINETKYIEEKKVENILVLVDRFGYAKTMDVEKTKSEIQDISKQYKYVFEAKDNDKLSIFTNLGNLYQINLKKVPKAKLKDKGMTIQSLARLSRNEYPLFIDVKEEIKEKTYLFVTKFGLTKQTKGSELFSNRSKIISTKLDKDDEVVFVQSVNTKQDRLVLQTKDGYVIQLNPNDFSLLGKTSKGMISIKLKDEDSIENGYLLDEGHNLSLSVNGVELDTSSLSTSRRGLSGKKVK